jgi:hypothetical protein
MQEQLRYPIIPWRAHAREVLIPRAENRRPPAGAHVDRGYAVAQRRARSWGRRHRIVGVMLVMIALAGLAFSC